MSKEIEIARLLNVRVNTDTGQVFLEMEVHDPVWKQRILREWQSMNVKLVIEKKTNFSYTDEQAEVSEEDFAAIKEQVSNWRSK
jgi:hypothetical protein